jgi:signal transduction histidine kinase
VWCLSFATWTVVWLVMSSQSYVYYRSRELDVPWMRFVGSFSEWLLWGFFTPPVLAFVWRTPLGRASWRRRLPLHLVAGILTPSLFVLLAQVVRTFLSGALAEPELVQPLTPGYFFRWYVSALFAYVDVVFVGHLVHYSRESKAKDLKASQLEGQLAQAQLQVLRMQLHPHFLFNTLHTISALMHKDLKAADRMLALLGDLLRDSLEKVGAQVVPLKQELEFLDRYLEIEKTRFRDRLSVQMDVDPETLDAEIPNLILQPLLENAIRHGIARRAEGGRIEIDAHAQDGMLVLRVRDDGPGLPSDTEMAARGGVGLANSQARLEQLYGPAHRFELRNRTHGGLEITLALPLRAHERPAAAASAVQPATGAAYDQAPAPSGVR